MSRNGRRQGFMAKKHMKRHTDPFIGFMVGHRAPECVQLPTSLIKNRPIAALSQNRLPVILVLFKHEMFVSLNLFLNTPAGPGVQYFVQGSFEQTMQLSSYKYYRKLLLKCENYEDKGNIFVIEYCPYVDVALTIF